MLNPTSVEALRSANPGDDELDDDDDGANSHSMQLDCLSLPPAPLPPPPTSTTSYHLPLATPTASLIVSDGADDLDSEDPTTGCLRSPALLPPTSRSSSPASHSHQSQPGGHRTRTSQPPSRPTPTLPTLVEHSNRAAPLTRKLNHLAQLACESIRRTHTRFPDVPTTPGGVRLVGFGVLVIWTRRPVFYATVRPASISPFLPSIRRRHEISRLRDVFESLVRFW
ncbi:hypothetical protein C8R46DRAFT_1235689 [Mycena filopes]|nr:hypothetical protein C8R46DRAFT_1235689 [Mycena filopes]